MQNGVFPQPGKTRNGRPPAPAVTTFRPVESLRLRCNYRGACCRILASGASPLSGRSAEEAGSRPSCGLVLCTSSFSTKAAPTRGISYSPYLEGVLLMNQGPYCVLSPPSICTRRLTLSRAFLQRRSSPAAIAVKFYMQPGAEPEPLFLADFREPCAAFPQRGGLDPFRHQHHACGIRSEHAHQVSHF